MPGHSTNWKIVAEGPTVVAVGGVGDCLDIFSLAYHSFHHLSRRQLFVD